MRPANPLDPALDPESATAPRLRGPNEVVNASARNIQITCSNPTVRSLRFLGSFVVPGLGMFCEAYFVFAIGNLTALWRAQSPGCWVAKATCPRGLSDSITYTQVCGNMFGHVVLGLCADWVGRKWGSVLTAAIMCIGAALIVAASGPTERSMWAMFTAAQFVFGVGVGGEYPVASASANERAEASRGLAKRRGETVVLVFSMQGWGNLVNTAVIIAIMAGFRQWRKPYDSHALEVTWRLSYALGCIPLLGVLLYRVFGLRESVVWARNLREAAAGSAAEGGPPLHRQPLHKLRPLLRHYWHRMAGVSLSWFVWDLAFFGNKLFQGSFIKVINPDAGLLEVLQWTLLNNSVALLGYYAAALTIDRPWMGRTRMQIMGFTWLFMLFLICAVEYRRLSTPKYIQAFQFLYYFSSFWGQFGPNATTFLLPAELAPTEVRSACHGFAAAVGKAGALVAGVVFGLVGDAAKFWISAVCGLAGALVTLLTIPDVTGLDLHEGDLRWQALLEGRPGGYTGEAANPRHLSLLERALGYGKPYVAVPYRENAVVVAAASGVVAAYGKGAAEVGDVTAAGGGNGVRGQACEDEEGMSGRCSNNNSSINSERRAGVSGEEEGR